MAAPSLSPSITIELTGPEKPVSARTRNCGSRRKVTPTCKGDFDDYGRETEEAFFGEDGRLRRHPNYGYAIVRRKFDTNRSDSRNSTEEAYFGEDEKLSLHPKIGCAVVRRTFDDRGRESEVACFGEDEKLRLYPGLGYALARKKFDDRGKMVEAAYFGEDEKLRPRPNGIAIERMKYDSGGRQTEWMSLASDGTLADQWKGVAAVAVRAEIVVRDEKGRVTARCENHTIEDFWAQPKLCTDGNGGPVVSHPIILEVTPKSQAQKLGLQNGDVIEAYDGKPVFTADDLIELTKQSGDGVRRVDVVREGRRLAFEAAAGRLGIQIGLTFVAANGSR